MLTSYIFSIRFLLVSTLLATGLSAYCQVTILEKDVILSGEVYDITVQKRDVTTGNATQKLYTIKAKRNDTESKSYELRSLEREVLEAILKKALLEAADDSNNNAVNVEDEKFKGDFEKVFNIIYPEIMIAAIRVADHEPIAGEIYIHDKIPVEGEGLSTSEDYYIIKRVPLITFKEANFSKLIDELTQRKVELTTFKESISGWEKEFKDLRIKLRNVENMVSSISSSGFILLKPEIQQLNNSVKQLNEKFSKSKLDIGQDEYIYYRFQNLRISLASINYNNSLSDYLLLHFNRNRKVKNGIEKYVNNVSPLIQTNLLWLGRLTDDINEVAITIDQLLNTITLTEEKHKIIQDRIQYKQDSLRNNQYLPRDTSGVKDKILEFQTRQGEFVKNLNTSLNEFNSNLKRDLSTKLITKEVQIVFNEGFIDDITVRGFLDDPYRNENAPIEFTHFYPIGFSSKNDFHLLSRIYLFEKRGRSPYNLLKLKLDDVFDYAYNLDLNTKDYSPHNEKYDFLPNQRVPLTKIESSKILEAKVFTDIIGIDADKPNGLLQTEVSRRINIWTLRRPVLGNGKNINFGWLSYINPSAGISIIEEGNRRLPLHSYNSVINGMIYHRNYTVMLELREYQNFNVGTDINFALADIPKYKSTILLNAGFRFGRTAVLDSTYSINNDGIIEANETSSLNEFGVSTLEFFPEISIKIQPERRYGFIFSNRLTLFSLLNPNIALVAEETDFDVNNKTNKSLWYNNFEIFGFLNFTESDKGRLFFRYRFFSNRHNSRTNFFQAQFGYSFYLLSRNQPRYNPIE